MFAFPLKSKFAPRVIPMLPAKVSPPKTNNSAIDDFALETRSDVSRIVTRSQSTASCLAVYFMLQTTLLSVLGVGIG